MRKLYSDLGNSTQTYEIETKIRENQPKTPQCEVRNLSLFYKESKLFSLVHSDIWGLQGCKV